MQCVAEAEAFSACPASRFKEQALRGGSLQSSEEPDEARESGHHQGGMTPLACFQLPSIRLSALKGFKFVDPR